MQSGTCPSCNAQTVYKQERGVKPGDGLYVQTSLITGPSAFDSYVCTTCGYTQWHITDAAKLQEVAKKWEKVG